MNSKNALPRKTSSLIASLSLLFMSPVLQAETENSLFDLSIEDLMQVKVTVASLFEESELDVASSVSLITRDDWNSRASRRTGDALETVPSIVSVPNWGGSEAIAIRGYMTELSVRGIANTMDGVPLNSYFSASSFYHLPVINLELLDRIEVIRGPGSTLYGTDAFHGVLSYQTRNSEIDQQEFRTQVGGPSYTSSSFFSSQNLGNIRVNSGIAVQKQGNQDLEYQYTSPYSGLTEYGVREHAYRDISGYINLNFGDDNSGFWHAKLFANTFDAQKMPSTGTQFFAPLTGPFDLESASITMDRDVLDQDTSFMLGQIKYNKQITKDLGLSAQVYQWRSEVEWRFDNSRYPDSLDVRPGVPLPSSIYPCLTAPDSNNYNPLYCSHELQQAKEETRSGVVAHLKSTEDQINTKWVFGIGADRQKMLDSTFKRIATDGTPYVDSTNSFVGDTRYIRFAFAQASTAFANNTFNLVYGVRLDDYSDVGSHMSPRLGFIFNVNESYTTKLLYGNAFRAPTILERQGNFDAYLPNPDIEPETIDSLEWVNIFHNKYHQTQLTVFGSKWNDGIAFINVGTGADLQYSNTNKNKSYGLELQTLTRIGDWHLKASGSYVRSRNVDSDQKYGAFPSWLFNVNASYFIPQFNTEISINERAMLNYRKADTLQGVSADRAKSYYRTDLNFKHQLPSKTDDQYELSLSVLNLLNRDNIMPSLYNAESGIPDFERRVVFGFDWKF